MGGIDGDIAAFGELGEKIGDEVDLAIGVFFDGVGFDERIEDDEVDGKAPNKAFQGWAEGSG